MRTRPCINRHEELDPDNCHYCKRIVQPDKRHARLWGYAPLIKQKEVITKKKTSQTYDCQFRGERTGKRMQCMEGCGKGTMIPLQQCSLFGECTVAVSVGNGVALCRTCKSRVLPTNEQSDHTLSQDHE